MTINRDRLSALISLGSAIVVVVATFFQWWQITYDGEMRLRGWVRALLVLVLVGLVAAALLLVWPR